MSSGAAYRSAAVVDEKGGGLRRHAPQVSPPDVDKPHSGQHGPAASAAKSASHGGQTVRRAVPAQTAQREGASAPDQPE